jgi:hypothetical protein
MVEAIIIAVALVFIGACIAGVVFAVRRYGWKPVYTYALSAIVIRILISFSGNHLTEGEKILVPAVGAFLILRLWPHVIKQKMREDEDGSL